MREVGFDSDFRRRQFFSKYESRRNILKSILYSQNLNYKIRWWAQLNLNKLPRSSSICRVKNRCIQTSRSKSVLSNYKLSRLRLRRLVSRGLFPGVRKASW
ncbi:unnamed protein product [Choristocarpus tenellus]|uniref:ribosomal protein S14 n=1 Tax=Choristocarpus tenellus TaxID=116065 RepID=UPI002E7774D1|nr:ribosomal protein S14 [Choristocarpus tenellus]WBP69831.1 ribosomal protein S14 [Choristocarpus tenellus]